MDNVVRIMQEKNYFGLDIDFEYIYPSDRELYNNFLRKVVNRLRPMGYTVTTALPKISAVQQGTLYEAHDYPVHGELADHVIIMTYEWGYTFSPPMAVAPLNEVRRVLNYAELQFRDVKFLWVYLIMAITGHCLISQELRQKQYPILRQLSWL